MYLRFSFFQPSSHFSWDTHSKQSFRLDEEGFLWLRFCSFGPWSNSFDLCRTFHALDASLSCICALCISLYALFWLFLHLILHLCFCFCVCKNPKTHKKWKIQKVWSYMFEHIPHMSLALYLCTYKWLCAFTSLTCSFCTYIFGGKILTSLCDCCKSIFKLVINY